MARILDDWLDTYMSYTYDTESASIFHKWVGLSCLAAALRKKTWFNFGRIRVYPNLYITLVGKPAARKTQALSYGKRILQQISEINTAADSTTKESLLQDLEQTYIAQEPMPDGTVLNHSSVTIISREMESFLGNKKDNQKLLVLLTDLFDVEEMPWQYRTKNCGCNSVPGVYVNIIMATTPDGISNCFSSSSIGGGFSSRLIYVWAEAKQKKVAIPERTPEIIRLEKELIQDLSIISRYSGEYNFSPDSRNKWIEWYESYDEYDPERLCKDPSFNYWYSRKPLFIKKVALLLTAARSRSKLIEWKEFQDAITLIEETEVDMERAFVGVGRSDITTDVDLFISIVRDHGLISEAKLSKMIWRDIDSTKLDKVAKTAMQTGKVERLFILPDGTRGIWYRYKGGGGKEDGCKA